MFIKEYKELLKAIWPMCRKNELYTEEMFIQDIIGKTKTLLSKHILDANVFVPSKYLNVIRQRFEIDNPANCRP